MGSRRDSRDEDQLNGVCMTMSDVGDPLDEDEKGQKVITQDIVHTLWELGYSSQEGKDTKLSRYYSVRSKVFVRTITKN